jgi:aerobic C4-dicarboxylate transport protein
VATVVVAKWTGELDLPRLQRELNRETAREADEPEAVMEDADRSAPAHPAR